jgi:hypothetical protein
MATVELARGFVQPRRLRRALGWASTTAAVGRPLAPGLSLLAHDGRFKATHSLIGSGCRTTPFPPRRGGSGASVPGHGERRNDTPRIPRRSPDVLAGSQDLGFGVNAFVGHDTIGPTPGVAGSTRLGRDRPANRTRSSARSGSTAPGASWKGRPSSSRPTGHLPGHLRIALPAPASRLGVARARRHERHDLAGAHAS